jgi:hypothetical protein
VFRETKELRRWNEGMQCALCVRSDDFDEDKLLAELVQELQFDKLSG